MLLGFHRVILCFLERKVGLFLSVSSDINRQSPSFDRGLPLTRKLHPSLLLMKPLCFAVTAVIPSLPTPVRSSQAHCMVYRKIDSWGIFVECRLLINL